MSTPEPELGSREEILHRRRLDAGMHPIRRLNAAAVALITHDVVTTTDQAMTRLTPYVGWTVADLIRHINDEHEAVNQTVLGPLQHRSEDPRDDFAAIAARWTLALAQAGPTLMVPKAGATIATDQVRAIHLVDMLVHRWDLTKATDRDSEIESVLADTALPIARSITAPTNPFGLVGLAYATPKTREPRPPPD